MMQQLKTKNKPLTTTTLSLVQTCLCCYLALYQHQTEKTENCHK